MESVCPFLMTASRQKNHHGFSACPACENTEMCKIHNILIFWFCQQIPIDMKMSLNYLTYIALLIGSNNSCVEY